MQLFPSEIDVSVQVFVIWFLIAVLALYVLLRKSPVLTLASNDRGHLQISRHAINRLVEACCEQVNGVASARASVNHRRQTFHTKIRLKVRPNAKLDAIQGYLTEEITTIFRQNLGVEKVGPIAIKVVGVIPAGDNFRS